MTTLIQGIADLISVYQGHISQFQGENGDTRFYHKPLVNNSNGMSRFGKQPVGRNTLSKIVPEVASSATLTHNFTSHTLKASCATQLYDQGVDEQLIMERTGHRSIEAVRVYKRTNDNLLQSVSSALEPVPKHPHDSLVQPVSTALRPAPKSPQVAEASTSASVFADQQQPQKPSYQQHVVPAGLFSFSGNCTVHIRNAVWNKRSALIVNYFTLSFFSR